MARGARMVDMARTNSEKRELVSGPPRLDPVDFVGDYPPGLCLSFDEETLEKLDLDIADIHLGDTIDLRGFAKVCKVSQDDRHCCVDIQICDLGVENESTEEFPGSERVVDLATKRAERRYK